MPYFNLALDARGPVAVITFGTDGSSNRLDRETVGELRNALDEAAGGGACAIVITGRDQVFSLGWSDTVAEQARADAFAIMQDELLGRAFQFVSDCPVPTIAAINGDAFSAGLELALACDLRIAARTARFGLPEVISGMIPMGGGTQRLARIAGRAFALQMILSGEPVDAAVALQRGLVGAVEAPERVLDAARELASTIAGRGPLAVRLAKEAIHRGLDMSLDQGLRYETDLTVLLQTTADRAEGVRGFVEKRRPHFQGE
jgi:enoyl-CoA hydratase/carnithine racemase